MSTETGSSSQKLGTAVWPLLVTMLLISSSVYAQERFFFNDDSGSTPATGTTPDGSLSFEIFGALAVTEGDIVLGNAFDLIHGKQTPRLQTRGLARSSQLDRWPDGIVYYATSSSLAQAEINKVADAVEHWNRYSSLRFVERTTAIAASTPDYINIIPGPGCGSYVGRIGGAQELWLNDKCSTGSLIHELAHAIGLFHEHTRSDRDNFITVLWNNIDTEKSFNFDIMSDGVVDVNNYDYGSIMHYGNTFFSNNGQPTILVPDGVSIGQREALSALDLASVNQIYATDLSLSSSLSNGTEINSVVVDVIASNVGVMGANTLQYSLPLHDGDSVTSFVGAGWSCVRSAESVECFYLRLATAVSTSLSITINRSTSTAALGDGYLSSKSFDTDLSNNGNAPAQEETEEQEPADPPVTTPVPDTTPQTEQNPTTDTDRNEPDQAAANPEDEAAGSLGWLLIGWMFVWVAGRLLLQPRR